MTLRILVVDDDADNREALALVIEALGAQAHTARSAEDALREAARVRPHAAFIDWIMPGTDGIRLSALLREQWPDLFIVLVTGYGSRELPHEAKEAGVDAHLLKPASMEEIGRVVGGVSRLLNAVQDG